MYIIVFYMESEFAKGRIKETFPAIQPARKAYSTRYLAHIFACIDNWVFFSGVASRVCGLGKAIIWKLFLFYAVSVFS